MNQIPNTEVLCCAKCWKNKPHPDTCKTCHGEGSDPAQCVDKKCECHTSAPNQIPNREETHNTRGWEDEFVEQGANLEHERWAKWQAYLHSKLYEIDDHRVSYNNHLKILPTELYERWERQIATPYKDLSEAEKESDRKEARTYLPLVHQELQKARHDWLREEIVKLEGMKVAVSPSGVVEYYTAQVATNQVLQTIIDRYQSELDQDKTNGL